MARVVWRVAAVVILAAAAAALTIALVAAVGAGGDVGAGDPATATPWHVE